MFLIVCVAYFPHTGFILCTNIRKPCKYAACSLFFKVCTSQHFIFTCLILLFSIHYNSSSLSCWKCQSHGKPQEATALEPKSTSQEPETTGSHGKPREATALELKSRSQEPEATEATGSHGKPPHWSRNRKTGTNS